MKANKRKARTRGKSKPPQNRTAEVRAPRVATEPTRLAPSARVTAEQVTEQVTEQVFEQVFERVDKPLVEPMQNAASARSAPAAEPMFSALEEAFFAAGTELSTAASAPVETFADLDAGQRPHQGFWRRLFARREPARWSPSNAVV